MSCGHERTVEGKPVPLVQLADEAGHGEDGGVALGRGGCVDAVEVDAAPVGAIVAPVDAVRVEQRHQLEDEARAQRGGARICRVEKELEEALEDVRGGRLSRVDTRRQQEDLLGGKGGGRRGGQRGAGVGMG